MANKKQDSMKGYYIMFFNYSVFYNSTLHKIIFKYVFVETLFPSIHSSCLDISMPNIFNLGCIVACKRNKKILIEQNIVFQKSKFNISYFKATS